MEHRFGSWIPEQDASGVVSHDHGERRTIQENAQSPCRHLEFAIRRLAGVVDRTVFRRRPIVEKATTLQGSNVNLVPEPPVDGTPGETDWSSLAGGLLHSETRRRVGGVRDDVPERLARIPIRIVAA